MVTMKENPTYTPIDLKSGHNIEHESSRILSAFKIRDFFIVA